MTSVSLLAGRTVKEWVFTMVYQRLQPIFFLFVLDLNSYQMVEYVCERYPRGERARLELW